MKCLRYACLILALLVPLPAWANSLILDTTSKSLELETSSAESTDYAVSWTDNTTTAFTPGANNGNIAAATTTTLVAAPAASTQRHIKWVSVRNRAASNPNTVTLKLDVSATDFHLTPGVVLSGGEELVLDAEGKITVFTNTGLLKSSFQLATNGLNSTGGTILAEALVGQCDDTSPTALTENSFGHARINCTTHAQLVDVATIAAGDTNIGNVDIVTMPSVTIGTFPDNEPFNVAQINGVTPLMGNGVTGTGSLRVTVASDNTAFTTNVGTFPDNEPFNVAQINGITPLMGNGVTGTGSQRVTIASDNTAFSVNVGTFPDNEPINVAQMNGVAVTMGNGVSGTGVQRVTLASDSTGTVIATQATAANLNATVVGTLADDGVAAATNRIGTLPAIAQSVYSPATSGRNTALNTGTLSGNLYIAQLPEPSIASYSASAVVASAASATDIAVLPGNATNTVLVTEVRVSCTQTTAGVIQLHLIKRSTADTAGTSVAMTEVPDDANYAAASSAALTYTANPTLGGTVGDLDIIKLGCMATGTTSPNDLYIANFRQKPIVLRGTAQQLAINLNGASVTGGSFALTYKWIETTGP